MERITGFIFGVVVGFVLCLASMTFHLVRAEDGWHVVPKISAQFADAYVDIREFQVGDWEQHGSLALALAHADKAYLMQKSASNTLQASVDQALGVLRGGK
jgi:hypothetical protein